MIERNVYYSLLTSYCFKFKGFSVKSQTGLGETDESLSSGCAQKAFKSSSSHLWKRWNDEKQSFGFPWVPGVVSVTRSDKRCCCGEKSWVRSDYGNTGVRCWTSQQSEMRVPQEASTALHCLWLLLLYTHPIHVWALAEADRLPRFLWHIKVFSRTKQLRHIKKKKSILFYNSQWDLCNVFKEVFQLFYK